MSLDLTPSTAELKLLETTFREGWDATNYPVVFGDDPFKGEQTKPWVRFSVLPGKPDRQDLGSDNTRHAYPGLIVVQLFIPKNTSVSPAWLAASLTDVVAGLFRDKEFATETGGQIFTYTTGYRRVPPEAGWQRFNITTPYIRYEVAS